MMSEDHVFIDSAGGRVTGSKNCLLAWEGFFRHFPDYKNFFERMEIRGNQVTSSMKVLLLFDKGFPIEENKLLGFLQQQLTHVAFELYSKDFCIEGIVINKSKTFKEVHKTINYLRNSDYKVLCFTAKQYDDNWFVHGDKRLAITSFYAWNFLTNLPPSNGIVYFISRYFAEYLNPRRVRHTDNTGCIHDNLVDKRGVDDGMRQARFCSNCLQIISTTITQEWQKNLFHDLKKLLNLLSEASRWNEDILNRIKKKTNVLGKRKAKSNKAIQVVIASPGDTGIERKVLLDSLERKFRIDNHEAHCGFRIIVNGWEDLAAQNGYAQDVINSKIIEESDFVIAVFKHRLGTPTRNLETGKERAPSGTAEELLQTLDKSKERHPIGMVYFYSKAPVISLDSPDKEGIEREWIRLTNFKASIQDKIIYKPYTEATELLSVVLRDLEKNIIDYIEK